MSNEELVKAIRQSDGDVSGLIEQLYSCNHGIISCMAKKYSRGDGALQEELEQEAYFAIMSAVDGFDFEAGSMFSTYLTWWLKSVMRRYATENASAIHIPAHQNERIRQYKAIVDAYAKKYNHTPTRKQIGYVMGLKEHEVEQLEKVIVVMNCDSLDAQIETDGEQYTLADIVADKTDLETEVEDKLLNEELAKRLDEIMHEELTEAQETIIKARYYDCRTIEQCGALLHMDPDEVKKENKTAMTKLRSRAVKRKLDSFITSDIAYSKGLNRTSFSYFRQTHTSSQEALIIDYLDGHNERPLAY